MRLSETRATCPKVKRKKGTCPKVKRKKGNVSQGETRAYCTPFLPQQQGCSDELTAPPFSPNSKVAQPSLLHPLSPPTARLLRRAYCTPFLPQQQGCSAELTAVPLSPKSKAAQAPLRLGINTGGPSACHATRGACCSVSTLLAGEGGLEWLTATCSFYQAPREARHIGHVVKADAPSPNRICALPMNECRGLQARVFRIFRV